MSAKSKAPEPMPRKRNHPSASSNASATTDDMGDITSPSSSRQCVVCCGEPSSKIVRDSNFDKVVQFYVEGLAIDVKPGEYSKFELCATCFENLIEFYDTNDVLILLEKHLNSLQRKLVSKTLEGIPKLKLEGNTNMSPTIALYHKLSKKYGDKLQDGDVKEDKEKSSVTTFLEDSHSRTASKNSPKTKEDEQSKSATASSPTKHGEKDQRLRKRKAGN